MDYTQIYQMLNSQYGSIKYITQKAGVSRNTVRNILLGITKRGPKAQLVKQYAEEYITEITRQEKERLTKVIQDRNRVQAAAALLETN